MCSRWDNGLHFVPKANCRGCCSVFHWFSKQKMARRNADYSSSSDSESEHGGYVTVDANYAYAEAGAYPAYGIEEEHEEVVEIIRETPYMSEERVLSRKALPEELVSNTDLFQQRKSSVSHWDPFWNKGWRDWNIADSRGTTESYSEPHSGLCDLDWKLLYSFLCLCFSHLFNSFLKTPPPPGYFGLNPNVDLSDYIWTPNHVLFWGGQMLSGCCANISENSYQGSQNGIARQKLFASRGKNCLNTRTRG